jgi:hypothetical protein
VVTWGTVTAAPGHFQTKSYAFSMRIFWSHPLQKLTFGKAVGTSRSSTFSRPTHHGRLGAITLSTSLISKLRAAEAGAFRSDAGMVVSARRRCRGRFVPLKLGISVLGIRYDVWTGDLLKPDNRPIET